MPVFNIIKESVVSETFRNNAIINQFEVNCEQIKEHFIGNIDIEDKEWNIGVIVGASGTGKSTISKSVFDKFYVDKFDYSNESTIENMPKNKSINDITKTFNSVGFSTPLSWLKPYNVLSNGEKMRVDLARAILEDRNIVVFDEFTSVVDRTVAKTASFAINKYIKRNNKKFVAVSCHKDVLDWLEPDWIYDTDQQSFFFAEENTKDQKSTSRYENVAHKFGTYLGSIII